MSVHNWRRLVSIVTHELVHVALAQEAQEAGSPYPHGHGSAWVERCTAVGIDPPLTVRPDWWPLFDYFGPTKRPLPDTLADRSRFLLVEVAL